MNTFNIFLVVIHTRTNTHVTQMGKYKNSLLEIIFKHYLTPHSITLTHFNNNIAMKTSIDKKPIKFQITHIFTVSSYSMIY